MFYVGLTGWGDHHSLYPQGTKEKLTEYSRHFPVVEVDSTFYAIQPERNMKKWVEETPDHFRFVVKAFQGMTKHTKRINFSSTDEMFTIFKKSLEPFIRSGKLAAVLFQFPPWFRCTVENVNYLRYCKQMMSDLPVALEIRNETWFSNQYRQEFISFMKGEGWIHSIVDEPQAGEGSAPTVLVPTNKKLTIVRMHGRNVDGWNKPNDEHWREVRYLYNYNEKELLEWKDHLLKLSKETEEMIIIFNNNSGGHAAENAKTLQKLLGVDYIPSSEQLELF